MQSIRSLRAAVRTLQTQCPGPASTVRRRLVSMSSSVSDTEARIRSAIHLQGTGSLRHRGREVERSAPKTREFHATHSKMVDADNMHEFSEPTQGWQDWRNQSARRIGMEEDKEWPLHTQIQNAGPAYVNVARKVRYALRQIDRMLDVLEPGQLAIAFNGGKDSTVVLHLVMQACQMHPTHKFTHVQPIWFKHPKDEFPEVLEYVSQTADQFFTHQESLKSIDDSKLNRLWTLHVTEPQDFIDALSHLGQATGIRCVIMGSRRTDPGSRDLSPLALMDLAPVFLSSTMTRMQLESKLNMLKSGGDPGLPGTNTSQIREPALMRFSPTLEWSYRDIWDFIGAAEVPYCKLYDDGYSSIGTMEDTKRNPYLLKKVAQEKSEIPTEESSKAIHSKLRDMMGSDDYELMMAARDEDVRKLGVANYDSFRNLNEYEDGDTTCGVFNNTSGGAGSQYFPAWALEDESKEGASRLRTEVSTNANDGADSGVGDSAAILVVGDQLMSGAVKETNSHSISSNLRAVGIAVKQVMIVESDIDIIAFMLRRLSPVHKYIFVCGGIGPGHGDVTCAAVAKAFGTGILEHPQLLDLIVHAVPPERMTEFHCRMAFIPFGAELLHGDLPGRDRSSNWGAMMKHWPVVKKNNCFLLPSKPSLMTQKFLGILPQISSSPIYATKVVFRVDKSRVASQIAQAVSSYDKVHANSYTSNEDHVVKTITLLESKDYTQQQGALKMLLDGVPESYVLEVIDEHVPGQKGPGFGTMNWA